MSTPESAFSPDHMHSEHDRWVMWATASVVTGFLVFVILFALAPLIHWLSGQPLNIVVWNHATSYLAQLGNPNFVLSQHNVLWKASWMTGFTAAIAPMIAGGFVAGIAFAASPFKPHDTIYGDVRWATDEDIRRMEKRRQIGIRGGYVGVLGKWKDGNFIRLIEPISVACSAPPGTGKTAAIVVPAIVTSDDVSMIVNDPKPELAAMTSGWRSMIGYVFILDWSKTDQPEKGIFYPRFNFLSPKIVPPSGTAERDTYLDAIAKVLIPESKGGSDKYFVDKGRDALTGLMHYLVAKVNDRSNYENIPEQWHGKEASFPMLVDFLAAAFYRASKEADAAREEAAKNRTYVEVDPIKEIMTSILDEISTYKYGPRPFSSITPLVGMADKERSGVLGTVDQALLPFKNAATAERTSGSDFLPSDLRGIKCPETGEWLPVTLYICVNQSEAAAFTTITSLLYEVLSREFLAYGPGEVNRIGTKLGDKTVVFMLDEFAKLPKSETVLTGPDLGRSKKVSYWLIFQSRSQIVKAYSKEDGTIIDSTCGVQIVLPQNDIETAKHYINMVGKTTIRKVSASRQLGFSKQANPWAKNESVSIDQTDFLRTEDVMAMKPGTHIILPQNFMNRPIRCKSPMFYEDPQLLSRVLNLRTNMGPKPANPLPEHIRQKRIKEWMDERKLAEMAAREAQARDITRLVEA